MSTSPASDPTPDPGPGVVTFTAEGERALDDLASRLAARCDGTTESITSLLEQVLTAEVADLAAALDLADPNARSRDRRELLDGVEVDETTPGQSPDETASRRLGAHTPDDLPGPPTTRREAAGPDR
ncbi:hypothetical protein [Nocardioides sp.]|uniref:hypothetical protein n=1 Tax=Nocardioides sp. TaxID=35761 RepID=UPI003D0974F9